MADPKKNPLIGAFRAPVPGAPPDTPAPPEAGKPPAAGAAKPIDEKKGQEAPKAPAGTTPKPADGKKEPEAPKAPADTSAKPADGKKEPEAPKTPAGTTPKPTDGKKEPEAPKAPADPLTKPADGKKEPEAPKAPADTSAKPADEKKGQEAPKAPADPSAKPADGKKSPVSDPSKPKDEKEQEPRSPDLRFVALSKIKPLPGTYVKDEPRKDYSGLIADIKKNGLQKPIILRQSEKEGEFQLVDGFHRCKALEQAGMLEVRADVYEMTLTQANEYRKGHRDKPLMPVPGKLLPYPPEEPAKADKAPEPPAGKEPEDEELPKDLKIPLTKEGQPETVTTMKVANIRPFEGHPFAVRDNKDMWDLVDSIKKFGVLEPVMVIPHKDGGYEMVSGHRRMRACQLAGIENIPVIVRNLDRDEAIISMVDSNLKREEISPMEKARAYPKDPDNPLTGFLNYDERTSVEHGAFRAWGEVIYRSPLTPDQIYQYELRPSRDNPDVRRTMAEQAQVVGIWEMRNHVPENRRMTRYVHPGKFIAGKRVTPEELARQCRLAQDYPFVYTRGPRPKKSPQIEGR